MKTLLALSPWFPCPADNGSRIRIFHLLRELSRHFRIRLVAGLQDDSPRDIPAPLARICEAVLTAPWQWHDGGQATGRAGAIRALVSPVPRSIRETDNPALRELIRGEIARRPDAVLVCELGIAPFVSLADLPPQTPCVLDGAEFSTAEKAQAAGLRNRLTYGKARAYWHTALRPYTSITAVSSAEADAVRRVTGAGGPPVAVVANGVEVAAYPPRDPARVVPGRLIYNGALTYGPNLDAARWFAREILPAIQAEAPDAHLHITGRYTPEIAAEFAPFPGVTLTGFVPDMGAELAAAACCVVPLQGGGGTRLKILEAWAAQVPVVSTAVGAAGLSGAHSSHLLLANDAARFALSVVRVLRDPALAQTLAQNGRDLAAREYDWQAIGATLAALLDTPPAAVIGTPAQPVGQ